MKQVRVLKHVGQRYADVLPTKTIDASAPSGFDTPREGLVGHVIFHDVDKRLVHPFLLSGKFIKGDHIPVADQADFAGRIIDKQLRNGHFTT